MSRKRDKSASFLERYLNGEMLAEDIDGFIDAWHSLAGKKTVFEFLGMTKAEYSLWLLDPDSLPHIAQARRSNMPLASAVRAALAEAPIAERPADALTVKRLRQWLEQQAALIG